MKLRVAQISIILATLTISGCFDPPEFSEIPYIEYESLRFVEIPADYVIPDGGTRPVDSLVLSFSIEDGDGDVGLRDNESFTPYHSFNLIIDSRDSLVTYTGDFEPPFYTIDPLGTRKPFSEEDNRPGYNCTNYIISSFSDLGVGQDTFYIQQNEFHYNLHVTILRKRNGTYSPVNYAEASGNADCALASFNGRIPIFEEDNIGRTLKGNISYSMRSSGHKIVLARDTFKIRFYMYDRALHPSNVVETPDFTLPDISAN